MSQKKDKALRKQYRRDVQDYLTDGGLFELYSLIIKPKPRFLPKWIWVIVMGWFINIQEDTKDAGEKVSNK